MADFAYFTVREHTSPIIINLDMIAEISIDNDERNGKYYIVFHSSLVSNLRALEIEAGIVEVRNPISITLGGDHVEVDRDAVRAERDNWVKKLITKEKRYFEFTGKKEPNVDLEPLFY